MKLIYSHIEYMRIYENMGLGLLLLQYVGLHLSDYDTHIS